MIPALRRLPPVLGLLALTWALAGCGPQAAPAPPPLRIAMDVWAGYYPLVVAEQRGELAAEHVAITLDFPEDTHRMLAEFAAGKYDAVCVSIGDIVLTTRVQPDIRMILCTDESAGGDQIFGREPLRDNAQIRGKRIGTALGGFGELFVRRFLEHRGLRPDDVVLVSVDSAAVPALLAHGEIDIGHTWEPYATQMRAAGWHTWFSSSDTPGLILDGMMAHAPSLDRDMARWQGLVRAWFRALDWWRAHPAEGNALIEKRLKLAPGSVSLTGIRLVDQAGNRRAFAGAGPGTLPASAAEYVEFYVSRGLLSHRPTAAELLDPRFVQ